jgi:serralysin
MNGTVSLENKGDADAANDEVIFMPIAGYSGPASFDYTVADGFGGEDTVTVSVTVTNREDGSSGNDLLSGTSGPDQIYGYAGNDVIDGGEGSDTLDGGAGNDALSGGGGNDRLIDGDGADFLSGDSGEDTITLSGTTYHTAQYAAYNVSSATQTGTGQLINLAGKVKIEAVIDGGADVDTIELSDQGDAFFLHDAYSGFHHSLALTADYIGNDSTKRFINVQNINGLGGDDIVDLTSPDYSLAGETVRIDGGEGNDVIWGSDADETIYGGTGNDTIFGGIGTDLLVGGAGADTFQFTRTSTDTTVEDFDPTAGDKLEFFNNGGAAFDPTSLALTDRGVRVAYEEAGMRYEVDIALAASADEFSWSLSQISAATDFL